MEVDKLRFVVGRHSESDLCIPDSRLSREHVRIERKGEDFIATDLGSSNGTTINGEPLTEPTLIKGGDEIVLGGSAVIRAEFPSDAGADPPPEAEAAIETPDASAISVGAASAAPAIAAQGSQGGSSSKNVFLFIPVLGLLILVMVGGLIYFLGTRKEPVIASDNEFQYSHSDNDDDDKPTKTKGAKKDDDGEIGSKTSVTPSSTSADNSTTATATPASTSDQPASNLNETAKVEQSGASFLRRIAQNDPKAFLTTDQAKRLSTKIKQFSNSAAVADNINSARKNAARILSLAASRNLKPQLLAVAAISKLGNSRGDVLQSANSLIDVLGKLRITINNEFSDDSLLMIAIYDRSASGDVNRTVNMLQQLATQDNTASARSVRTIWFLEKNGKITPAEFDAALTFLAIGTITQNPKDFGVNAEALNL